MVFFNYALRKLNAKIVYYGPGLCGKTTNLQWIHDHFEGGHRGEMISLATEGDRTIFFDLLPLEIGKIRGLDVTLQLYTVPGQVHYNSTRQLVLKGADGVVFVADSQRAMRASNTDSWNNLKENLLLQGIELSTFPHVLQFNKRDLRDIMSLEEMDEVLNEYDAPFFESVATDGIGVQETLEGIVKLVMRSLRDRYEPVGRSQDGSSLRAPQPGAGLRAAGAPAPPVAAFKPPVPDASLAPPAGGEAAEEAESTSEVSEEAVTHPSMSISPPPNDDLWTPGGPVGGGPGWTEPGEVKAFEPAVAAADEDQDTTPSEVDSPARPTAADTAGPSSAASEGFADGGGADEGAPPANGEVTIEIAPPATADRESGAEETAVPSGEEITPRGEEVTGPITEGWRPFAEAAPVEVPVVEKTAGPFSPPDESGKPEVAPPGPPSGSELPPFPVDESRASVGESSTPGEGAPPFEAPAGDVEPPLEEEPVPSEEAPLDTLEPPAGVQEPSTGDDSGGVTSTGATADELLRQALDATAAPAGEAAAPPQGAPGEDVPASEPALPGAEQGLGEERAAPVEPVERTVPKPVIFGSEDPFAFAEPAAEAPVRAEASAVVTVPSEDQLSAAAGPLAQGAGPNQLQLRIEGTRALARSGDVRELDIMVPVPGNWIGNRRVTLQLRLTLVPAEDDQ